MQNGNIHFTVPDGGIFDSGDTKTKEVYTNVGLPFVYENGYYTFDASQDSAYFSGTAASETNLTWNDTAQTNKTDNRRSAYADRSLQMFLTWYQKYPYLQNPGTLFLRSFRLLIFLL